MNGEQDKLNDAMKRHLEIMKLVWFFLRYFACMALMFGGAYFLGRTNGSFGDVPLVLGAFFMFKTLCS